MERIYLMNKDQQIVRPCPVYGGSASLEGRRKRKSGSMARPLLAYLSQIGTASYQALLEGNS